MNRTRTGLIDRLETCSADYVWYISHLPEEEIHHLIAEGGWTIHQIAAHMRDAEREAFLKRTEQILVEEHPMVANYIPEDWDRDHYRREESLQDILSEFRSSRRKLLRLLRGAREKDWENWATHPEYGKISLDWILEHAFGHTMEHLAQISHLQERTILRKLNG